MLFPLNTQLSGRKRSTTKLFVRQRVDPTSVRSGGNPIPEWAQNQRVDPNPTVRVKVVPGNQSFFIECSASNFRFQNRVPAPWSRRTKLVCGLVLSMFGMLWMTVVFIPIPFCTSPVVCE